MVTGQSPAFPFPATPDTLFTPLPAEHGDLAGAPVVRVTMPSGDPAWLITRHRDVRDMLRSEAFSSDLSRPGFPLVRPLPPQGRDDRAGVFIRMDGDEHRRFRRMLTAEFMIKNIRRIEPMIHDAVVEALSAMRAAGPPADLVDTFALPVPSMVICHLLGVPYRDHAFFQSRSRALLARTSTPDELDRTVQELRGYLGALIDEKHAARDAGEDLLGRLVADRLGTGEVTRDELIGIALLLLVAGHETTANMIGLSVLLLLNEPDRYAALRADPEMAPGMVEELLRFLTIVRTGLPRVAVEDVEIGGQAIAAGEGVIAMLSTANRDEEVFADPADVDLYREAHQHVAFGFGVHQCIGQPLARAELRVALVELARALPTLRTAVTPGTAAVRDNALILGLDELPVTW